MTFQHRAGVSPYTSPCGFARTCVFSKQSLPPGLCDPHPQPARGLRVRAPLLPKLRGRFAEFLHRGSPVRLGMLCPTTCVGLGYGRTGPSRRGFSRRHRITLLPRPVGPGHHRASPPPSKAAARICLGGGPRAWTGRAIRPAGPPLRVTPVNTLAYLRGGSPDPRRPAPARPEDRDAGAYTGGAGRGSAPARRHGRYPVRYGNINPSSIDYARRPRLRSRLTQGGPAWPWNPWSYGAGDSHPSIATHACILTPAPSTPGHPTASPRAGRSPTTRRAPPPPHRGRQSPSRRIRGFGGALEPRSIVGARPLDQ